MSDLLSLWNQHPELAPYLELSTILIIASSLFFVCRSIARRVAVWASATISVIWARPFLDPKFLTQVAWIIPISVIHAGIVSLNDLPPVLSLILQKVALVTLVIVTLRALTRLLSGVNDVYSKLEVAKNRPIKGFIQIILIVLHIAAAILVISILLDRSPWVFLSGLAAMSAIILLVFRDTILSFVAGVQLTTNNLIRVGDWVEIPQFGADGDVIDIALNSVRVQNWDRTITVIPTHKFLEHSFKNWRGMSESGGRRIKRAVYIDMSSIRFLTDQEIEDLGRFHLLQEYLQNKKRELEDYNQRFARNPDLIVNCRRLTNIGTFRAYLINYLQNHPRIHHEMTRMVRQLAPGPQGLPLEIYAFTNTTKWVEYEGIQSDIFDHLLAILPEFGLKVFQEPTGHDFKSGGIPLRSVSAGAG